ncbi:MAG: DUF6036 family nucleotidyltransferase [Candidatus Binatia bacterium]
MLTAADLHDAFMELGARAQRQGKVIDLAIYGGSALMLASNFRVTTRDVDAVAEGSQDTITRLVEDIARARNWPSDWLNDGVRTYLSLHVSGLQEHHALMRAYPSEQEPGLRVFVSTPEYMLAMKLMAMRIDPTGDKSDVADIINLIDIVGFTTPEELVDFAADFYPEAKINARLRLGIRELWRIKDNVTQKGRHAPPSYLGRGCPSS